MTRQDARGDGEQCSCSPSQAEEEVPQLVHPQDQQHGAGALRPSEGAAGVTGEHSHGNATAKEELPQTQGEQGQTGEREVSSH